MAYFDPSYFDPSYFDAPSYIANGGGTSGASSTLMLGVKGRSDAVSDNSSILYAQYSFIASIVANANTLNYPQVYYNVMLNSDAVASVNVLLEANEWDVELFNNDPDVAVDEYVLIFKRKP